MRLARDWAVKWITYIYQHFLARMLPQSLLSSINSAMAMPTHSTPPNLAPEVRALILEFALFPESELNDFMDIPAFDSLILSQQTTWRSKMQLLLTSKTLLEEGLSIFYRNYFRICPRSIAQASRLAPPTVNAFNLMKKMWLVDDCDPAPIMRWWWPGKTDICVPALFQHFPNANPDILYIGYIFPHPDLLNEHNVLRFRGSFCQNNVDFYLRHPTLGMCARIIVSKEARIPIHNFNQAATARNSQDVHRYLEFAREHALKENALSLVAALEDDAVNKHEVTNYIYECVTPAGYGILACKNQQNNVRLPVDCRYLASPQPVNPSQSMISIYWLTFGTRSLLLRWTLWRGPCVGWCEQWDGRGSCRVLAELLFRVGSTIRLSADSQSQNLS